MREHFFNCWRVTIISRRIKDDKLLKVEVNIFLAVVVIAVELSVIIHILDKQDNADLKLLAFLKRLVTHLALIDPPHSRLTKIPSLQDLIIYVAERVFSHISPIC